MKKIVLIIVILVVIPCIYSCKDDENTESVKSHGDNNVVYPISELYGTYERPCVYSEKSKYRMGYIIDRTSTFQGFTDSCFWILTTGSIAPIDAKISAFFTSKMYKRGEYYYELEHNAPNNNRMKGKFVYDSSRYEFVGIYSSDTNFNDTIGTFYYKQISRDTSNHPYNTKK